MINLMKDTIFYVISTLVHDAVPLSFGIVVACILNVYVDPQKFKALLLKKKRISILGSVAFGTFTPLCACGTMAVVVSMLTTVLPWGPIMAFITSSPLMSPDLFVMLSGIINVKFAVALTAFSICIGAIAGYISYYLENHTTFFYNQLRFTNNKATDEGVNKSCCVSTLHNINSVKPCCTTNGSINKSNSFIKKYKIKELFDTFIDLGVKKILVYFSVFAAIGYFINRFVPTSVIMSLFGSHNIFSVPLAALIGVPLYVSDAGTIPLIKTLLDSGASGGAILAFMITGPGTSVGAIAGSLTIMKKKSVCFYVGILFASAILFGYLYNFLLYMGM
ncbi:permease [Anaeromicropila herbilytica]|uniref:Permease n=1 Tax=Anaeromicropila herbilytica TaxID=2785025 RepID=A0A7R7ELF6_9FIRM|nr:permease [Anaeromicropila herbilytica]BCN31035.1 permease [Anaeromicropila herbilytica]